MLGSHFKIPYSVLLLEKYSLKSINHKNSIIYTLDPTAARLHGS